MRHHETGVTLIELMIVLLISALLTAAIYAAFISQQKSYAIQTGVTDMQQNARAALTLMERDLRMAGFCVGDTVNVVDYWGNNVPNAITITDNTSPTPDQITVVYAAQQVSTVTNIVGNTVTLDSGGDQFDTGDNNRQYIAFETERTVYTITGISDNDLTLNSSPPVHLADLRPSATPPPPSGAQAYLIKAITYQVDLTKTPPALERVDSTDATAPDADDLWDDIAGYVTDLQAAWVDTNNTLLQVTLTSTLTDPEGTARTREHQAVINIRNSGL